LEGPMVPRQLVSQSRRILVSALALTGLLGLALAGPRAASADDRNLLRESTGDPYVFILFDTSGSMHWTPKCPVMVEQPDPTDPTGRRTITVQVPANAADCAVQCTTGDCFAPRSGDDPNSKFFQAKEALYRVLESVDGINFGFATYNQDDLRLRAKHWLYRATTAGPMIPSSGSSPARALPAVGDHEVFGYQWACDSGSGDAEVGCIRDNPVDIVDGWELMRVLRFPKGGTAFNQAQVYYVRQGTGGSAPVYRLEYTPVSGSYGAPITVRVRTERCTGTSSTCSSRTLVDQKDVVYAVVGEFAAWENQVSRGVYTGSNRIPLGYFPQGAASDVLIDNNTSSTCNVGWDSNTDSSNDLYDSRTFRWPTVNDPDGRGTWFSVGDVVPLDWTRDHRRDIMSRLAPNTALNATAVPDFRTSVYFEDVPRSGKDYLFLKNDAARPLASSGSTPLGYSVRSFRTWYAGCDNGNCPRNTGWKHVAAARDPDWACRRKFLLVITDGDDTCGGPDACSSTAALLSQEGITTYVVAFGVENQSGNRLNCMASNGGSGDPIYPQSKDELIKALTSIFGQIKEKASAFASAAVPSVQAEVADRIYLSSFTPLNGAAIWDGHLDAYLKPLPLTSDGKPARGRACPPEGSPNRGSCHLWDAGEELVDQAPTASALAAASVIDNTALKLGLATDQRRVFHAKRSFGDTVPTAMRLFSPPSTTADWEDVLEGFKITYNPSVPAEVTAARTRATTIFKNTLVVKTAEVEDPSGADRTIQYVLGDIFHSDPVIVDRPNDFGFFSADLNGNGDTDCDENPGYRCFAEKHRRRRKMLMVGSNDGQLHFFDAGVWNPSTEKFTDGTGRELFSYMPRLVMPVARELVEGRPVRQIFGVDATPRIDDVFLDPRHNGSPDPDQREWRTVVIGGLREGGALDGGGRVADFVSGYYALDITQPDQLTTDLEPEDMDMVPSCLSLNNSAVTDCGTLPFPSVLWEFTDAHLGARRDEDGNGSHDLGQTWSVPTVGRVRVDDGTEVVAKFVAIFGGGMDADSKASPVRGNWLYMVDIETGKVIYKRRLTGAAAADPAALDVDLDGFLDTLYITTTAGFVYKVNIAAPGRLIDQTVPRTRYLPALGSDQTEKRIHADDWRPYQIFNTQGRPLYFSPTVFYVSKLNRFALAFGTGDREDLWNFNGQEGRFYLIIDDNFAETDTATNNARTEAAYQQIIPEGAAAAATEDFVLRPGTGRQRGWYMRLEPDEKVITQAFGLSGILIFSSFQPQVVISGSSGSGNGNGGNRQDDGICSRSGESRIFVVFTNNANAIMSVSGAPSRFRIVPEFVTNPYVEQGSTKNPDSQSNQPNSEMLDITQKAILQALKKFYPAGTKFGNYWISVSGIRSDTGYERYATIPVGIIQRNWKEH
jgi:Tfp pilus tip-associated adhesin PilY1